MLGMPTSGSNLFVHGDLLVGQESKTNNKRYNELKFSKISCCRVKDQPLQCKKSSEKKMEGLEEHKISISKVVKIDSKSTWDSFVTQAVNQGSPIVALFTASWCMPSVAMNPLFEEFATKYQDIVFLLVDVDDVKEVASKYEVKAMPTFLLMKEGAQIDKLVGANPDEIKKRVESLIQSPPIYVA